MLRSLFEKRENAFGATIVTYFWYFWDRFSSIFEQISIIFWLKFGISCFTCFKRPRDGLKIAQDGFLEATWAQLEPKLAPSCLEMGPSWLHVGSSWAQVGPKICPGSVQETLPVRSKRVLGGSRWLQELKRLSGPLQGPIFAWLLIIFDDFGTYFGTCFWSFFDFSGS